MAAAPQRIRKTRPDGRARRMMIAAGAVVLALLLLAWGLLGDGGIGELDAAALVTITWLGAIAAARGRLRRVLLLAAVVTATTYPCLLLGELLFLGVQGPVATRDWRLSMMGAFRPVEPDSYELVPGWQGHWDDGLERHRVTIGENGNRDEPRAGPCARRVVLAGDSFAFGLAIAREHCVDVRMEACASVPTDVVNLGVPGYGPWDTYGRVQRSSARGTDLVYLFFTNDLRRDQAARGSHTAVAGVIVTRTDRAGRRVEHRAQDVVAGMTALARPPGPLAAVKSVLRLERVRARARQLLVPDARIAPDVAEFTPAGVDEAVAAVDAMARLARERQATFTVAIAPAPGEAAHQQRLWHVEQFVERVRAAGHAVIDLLPLLAAEHYLGHDPHWNAKGADVCARALIAHLEAQPAASGGR